MRTIGKFCAALATIGIVLAAPLAQASADVSFDLGDVSVDVNFGPPPARAEPVPPPRHGYAWAPGYWRLEGHHHEWVGGHWIKAHQGQAWQPDHWTQVGRHWHYEPGHWSRAGREHHEQDRHEADRGHDEHHNRWH
jgi:hypothetical protein